MASRNGSGMKILWIPGRKRHDKKGIYKPTNKVAIESQGHFLTCANDTLI